MSSVGDSIRNTSSNLQVGVNNAVGNMGQVLSNTEKSISDTTKQISQGIQDFGSKVSTNVSNTDFLTTNSIVAKTVFILLLLIIFLILFRVCVYIMQYFMTPNQNPLIINGLLSGNRAYTISRNPKKSNSVVLPRSNNQPNGLEATWSFWMNISSMNRPEGDKRNYMHVFNVGDTNWDKNQDESNVFSGISKVNNAPGVYLIQDLSHNSGINKSLSGYVNMVVVMDTESPTDLTEQVSVSIDDLPYDKWFHVAIRLENTVMDVYVNGLLTERLTFENVPKQNFYDINVCQNGGFSGYLSNLQYHSRALNVFDINSILFWGPNLKPATVNGVAANLSVLSNYNYLSSDWYFSKLGIMKF
jgi:hypothetical protein